MPDFLSSPAFIACVLALAIGFLLGVLLDHVRTFTLIVTGVIP